VSKTHERRVSASCRAFFSNSKLQHIPSPTPSQLSELRYPASSLTKPNLPPRTSLPMSRKSMRKPQPPLSQQRDQVECCCGTTHPNKYVLMNAVLHPTRKRRGSSRKSARARSGRRVDSPSLLSSLDLRRTHAPTFDTNIILAS